MRVIYREVVVEEYEYTGDKMTKLRRTIERHTDDSYYPPIEDTDLLD